MTRTMTATRQSIRRAVKAAGDVLAIVGAAAAIVIAGALILIGGTGILIAGVVLLSNAVPF